MHDDITFLDAGHTISDHLELKTSCVCPGDTVTFAECTTVGRGFTIWSGTAFNCTNDDIVLRHSTFNISAEECNKGAIIGRGLMVADNQYTSQLNITISSDIIGKTIQCYHESFDTQNTTEVGTLTISKPGMKYILFFRGLVECMHGTILLLRSSSITHCTIRQSSRLYVETSCL